MIGSLSACTFGFSGNALIAYLSENNIGTIEDGAISNVSALAGKITLHLSNCQINTLGAMFRGLVGASDTTFSIFLDNNNIDGESLKTALNSLSSTPANIFMYLEVNNVTVVPGQLFSSVGTDAPVAGVYYPSLNIDLRYNPISSVKSSAFTAGATGANLDAVTLWLDYPTAGAIQFDGPVGFDGVTWVMPTEGVLAGAVGGSFTLSLCGTGVDLSVAKMLGFHNPPKVLNVVLQGNGYTDIPSGALSDTILTSIDLSNNFITQVAQDVFTYNFDVQALDLSNNRLGVVLTETLNTLPVLGNFQLYNNPIWAIQQTNTHLSSGSNVLGSNSILQCSGFGAFTTGCTCPLGYYRSSHCGYWRCTPEPNGCPLRSFFNSSDCTDAPLSQCVNASNFPEGQYYDESLQAFLPLTNCTTLYPDEIDSHAFLQAYQFRNFTHTSNRVCAPCSVCPSGYDTSPCTITADSKCTKTSNKQLTAGQASGVVLAVLVPTFVLALLYMRYKASRSELGQTKSYLQLTEQLLGDERDEKEQMEQAWTIAESDISFGAVIGEGACGRVYKGMWGHIEVAIKVLRMPIDELDVTMRADFDREVKFMRSIRSPNLLTFYGAGVDEQSRAFLVTELMQGSLKDVLLDRSTALDWDTRLRIAEDVAKGMNYLHLRGAVHRDLKVTPDITPDPHNCYTRPYHMIPID
jgi:hypothetical protein